MIKKKKRWLSQQKKVITKWLFPQNNVKTSQWEMVQEKAFEAFWLRAWRGEEWSIQELECSRQKWKKYKGSSG